MSPVPLSGAYISVSRHVAISGYSPTMDAKRIDVVKRTCRVWSNASCAKKYSSITSRQTMSSIGVVVTMFAPKQNRAMLITVSSYPRNVSDKTTVCTTQECHVREAWLYDSKPRLTLGKLFSTLPCVRSVNTRNAGTAIVRQATRDTPAATCVTWSNRSIVGVRILP